MPSGLLEKAGKAASLALAVYADSLETVEGAIEGGCRRIYFEPFLGGQGDRAKEIRILLQEARAICQKADAELIWKWPKITRDDFLKICPASAQ